MQVSEQLEVALVRAERHADPGSSVHPLPYLRSRVASAIPEIKAMEARLEPVDELIAIASRLAVVGTLSWISKDLGSGNQIWTTQVRRPFIDDFSLLVKWVEDNVAVTFSDAALAGQPSEGETDA